MVGVLGLAMVRGGWGLLLWGVDQFMIWMKLMPTPATSYQQTMAYGRHPATSGG